VVGFDNAYDAIGYRGNAAAALALLLERPENLGRNDELPWILVEKPDNGPVDLLVGYDVAVTDKHGENRGGGTRPGPRRRSFIVGV